MSDEQHGGQQAEEGGGADAVAVLYILGGIPAIVAFIVILFTIVQLFPSVPA
jgi:hypothetical protein